MDVVQKNVDAFNIFLFISDFLINKHEFSWKSYYFTPRFYQTLAKQHIPTRREEH